MRRLLPLILLAALAPLSGASASGCAQPAEGEPTCCPPNYLLEIDDVVYLGVHDPTNPNNCS